ncbi:hypothetical protein FisN_21Hh194 [Fistulifera solaris]|jgi:hypothetical protein|uniref:Uncharacterized protein n=1 Tax=Fistulifera solaris TaxID=1519565 RepID=A0A1Z5JSJ4_FISSO|nr:hypothetical protein FisN_21Hh194 [Fistulifera solaris]|eukprot:GAX16748.1 hypothetical protein FisN_21Hh194 [Fistulifera solaris]
MSETPIAKTGRKGDPRMHRAVAARLANPNLSLFQALKEGGFDYADDEDGSCLDGDNVKLGQRKNQLSRRVRLARKHDLNASGDSSNRKKARKGDVDESDYLNQQALLEEEMKNMDDMQESNARTIRAKFHPDYHPLVLQPHLRASAATASSFFNTTPQSTFASAPMFSFGSGGSATGASGVAVASLTRTASSIGMTLEQLALVLQNPQILAQLVQSATDATASTSMPTASPARASSSTPAWQLTSIKDIALAIFRSKCRPLYEASMLQAGFPVEDTKEQSRNYLQFAWEAWQDEGKRLQQMIFDETNAKVEFEGIHQKQESADRDHHEHDHDQEKRHIHRLEGKCGHRAILHQPPNGIPHIDFVVGDTIECYQGHKPSLPIWPSKYSCQDLSCEFDACNSETQSLMTPMNIPDPKIFRMDEINIDGKEWVSDFNNDETIVGLIKLGDSV